MPTSYSGNPSTVTNPAPLTVTAVTNTIPATVTVSGSLPADFFVTGGFGGGPSVVAVSIRDVQGAGLANGVWNATATGPSTFTIDNTIAPGAYSSGGTVQPLCLSPVFTCPSDGDADSVESIQSLVQTLADRTQYLASRTSVAKLVARWQLTWTDVAGTDAWAVFNSTATANTWFAMPQQGALTVQGNLNEGGSTSIASVSPGFGIDGVTVNDAVHVTFDSLLSTGTASPVRLGLWGTIVDPGISRPPFSTSNYAQFPGCSQIVPFSSTAGQNLPVHLDGWLACNLAPALGQNTGVMYIWPAVYSLAVTGAVSWVLEGDTSLVIEVWRQTGVPQ